MSKINDESKDKSIELTSNVTRNRSSYPLLETEEGLENASDPLSVEDGRRKWKRRCSTAGGRRSLLEGWKFTIFWTLIASLVVLFFNVGFLIYCHVIDRKNTKHTSSTTLYEGDCERVQNLSTGSHLLINVLSTVLLSASNFGMQCLAAPTRQDLDRQHMRGRWLDVGVHSLHNLSKISTNRVVLWLFLAASSLPLHLIYNSVIYSSTSVTAYDVFAGPGSLGQKDYSSLSVNITRNYKSTNAYTETGMKSSFQELYDAARNDTLRRMETDECINAFEVSFQMTYKKLWLVTDDIEGNNTSYMYAYNNPVFSRSQLMDHIGPYEWLCSGWNEFGAWTICNPNDWRLYAFNNTNLTESRNYQINYCMAEEAVQDCKLQYSFPLIITVIVFNIVKTCVLAYMWLGIKKSPILTIGDTVASYLRRPDPLTQNECLLTRSAASQRFSFDPMKRPSNRSTAFDDTRRRWATAVSVRRWLISISIWTIAMIVCLGLLIHGLAKVKSNSTGGTSSLWHQSFGSSSEKSLIYGDDWPTSLVSNVVIANSPQLIFSFLYFAFNGLLTSMNLAAEWSGYAKQRKGLRVSHNQKGNQRANYFLSIPYRYSIPLLIVSIVLHWLISQSLYLVTVEGFDTSGQRDKSSDFSTCNWSPVGVACAISVGTFMFVCLLGLSFRKFESAMPVASSCSFAIAAACHPTFDPNTHERSENGADGEDIDSEREEEDMSLLPVQWGAIPVHGPIGHCSFTSGEVEMPQKGGTYQ